MWSSNSTSEYISKELTARLWRNVRTSIFIVALFTVGKRNKQPKCPWRDKWINKIQYIHTMEYYSFFFFLNGVVWGILVPWPRMEPVPLSLEKQSPNHWTTKEVLEYYSFLKRKKILPHDTMWVNLEDIMLSEKSWSQKQKYCMIPLIWSM